MGWRETLFSLKTFGAALLALFVAFRLDLPQPTWALLTAIIVSQPVAGMVASKSLFRVLGTAAGASMALLLVAMFAQAAPFFIGALALWIGLCTGAAVLLRDQPSPMGRRSRATPPRSWACLRPCTGDSFRRCPA